MSTFEQRIRANMNNLEKVESLYQEAIKNSQTAELKTALESIQNNDPANTVVNFYLLKLASSKETQQPAARLENAQRKQNGLNLSWLTLLFSGVTGILLWAWFKLNEKDFFIDDSQLSILTFLIIWTTCLNTYQIVRARHIRPWALVPLLLTPIVLVGLALLPGNSTSDLTWLLALAWSWGGIGLSTLFIHQPDKFKLSLAFQQFVSKSTEVFAIAFSFLFGAMILFGLLMGLLTVSQTTFSPDLITFGGCLIVSLAFFVALQISYNPMKPLWEQQSVFSADNLIARFALVAVTGVGLFLVVYLSILAPQGFKHVLETGDTVTMFLALVVLIQQMCLFALPAVNVASGQKKIATALWSWLLAASLLLTMVAGYALVLRVNEYSWTASRMLVALILLITLVHLIVQLLLTLKNLNKSLHEMLRSALLVTQPITLLIALVSLTLLTCFVDLNQMALRIQIARFTQNTTLDKHLDRYFMRNHAAIAIPLLGEKCPDVEALTQIDIALTLYGMKSEGRTPAEQELIRNYLNACADKTTHPDVAALLKQYAQAEQGTEQLLQDCRETVTVLTGARTQDSDAFCSYQTYYYYSYPPQPVIIDQPRDFMIYDTIEPQSSTYTPTFKLEPQGTLTYTYND